jgi:hypothetical protein
MLVVVGGHSRRVGKTSVIAGIIRALPEAGWTAIKISGHLHGAELPYSLSEETDAGGRGDTSRYLAAGARRALWLRGELAEGMPVVREILAASRHTIVESNSVLKFVEPDLYLAVLDSAVADVKASARRYFPRADAVVVVERGAHASVQAAERMTRFPVQPPDYSNPALVEFVRRLLH